MIKLSFIGLLGLGMLVAGCVTDGVLAQTQVVQSSHASGREWNFTTRSWQSQDGLPEETVQAFAQTLDGYLWVGTSGGLLRFDGARFRLFAHENTAAFGENSVFCLLAGHDGRLWAGTDGSGLIEEQDGAFRSVPVAAGQSANFVRALAEDHNGLLWVATDDGLFWEKNGVLERADKPLGLPVFNVHAVTEDRTGRIWIGGSRLYALTNGVAHEYVLPGSEGANKVKSILQSSDGTLWVGTVGGLYRLLPGQQNFVAIPDVTGTIRTLCEAPNGELWAGAIGAGIYRIRGVLVSRLKAPALLISNTVLSIFADSDHDLWLGTQAGMMRLSRTPVRTLALSEATDSDFGTVALDTDGSLWAASNQLLHVQEGKATPAQFSGLGKARIRNVLRAHDGSLWVGTDGSGVYRISSQQTTHWTTHEGLVNNFVRAFLESKDGSLWIGTDNGVSHLDHGILRNFTVRNGLAYDSIRTLLEDQNGVIWIGAEHGLSRYKDGAFVHDSLDAALSDEKIWALHQDSDGGVWIGTRAHGLYRYRNGKLFHFTTANGLASDSIYSILEDKQGHFWFSGPSGVMLLNRAEMDAKAEGAQPPLAVRIFRASESGKPTQLYGGTQPAGVLTKSGEAWFPTSQGLWSIRPDELEHPGFSTLNIDAVSVDGRPAPLGTNAAANLTLKAGSSRLEITYASVLLRSQDGLRFRYKLEGYDAGWTYANAWQRVATYTNLPSGSYTFLVEAWETDQPAHVAHASLVLVKKPYFFQTAWFILLSLLVAGGIIFLANRQKMRQVNQRFEAVLAERTRLAREMHDTLIQGCAGVSAMLEAATNCEDDDHESRQHLIEYASTQIRSTIDEARQAVWNLRSGEEAPNDLASCLSQMADRLRREHGIRVEFSVDGEPFALGQRSTHELMMVAREIMFNAVQHASPNEISVALIFTPNSLEMRLADDGRGFDVSVPAYQGHYGLKGVRERVSRLKGELEIESQPAQGTQINVRVARGNLAQ